MAKKEFNIIAGIDVGSNYLRIIIAQSFPNNTFSVLEDVIKPTNIGKDTFAEGRISIQTIHETCSILKGFSQLMKDYRIKIYKAVSTSGIREAENREYVLEQIRLRSGLNVEIINNAQERFLSYKALRNNIYGSEIIKKNALLIINITSGGIEASIYDNGNLKFTEYIKLGSLRLAEALSELEDKTLDFGIIMEEFIESKIYLLKKVIIDFKIKDFIGLGGELTIIHRLCGCIENKQKNSFVIEREALNKLYNKILNMTYEQIADNYNITKKEAEILLPSVILFHSFIKLTEAKEINAPMISLRHGLLYDLCDDIYNTPVRAEALNDIISSVWFIAEKYNVDKKHAEFIEKIALLIFDKTYRYHMLGERERLYLQVASILHDVGNYVDFSEHDVHSYNIIRIRNITGFSNNELNLIANIARYHANEIPLHSHENYNTLVDADKIILLKLSAILKLAEALDVSHKQKIQDIEIYTHDNKLCFYLNTKYDTILEQWDFSNNAKYFEEVMGIEPITKHRG